MGRDSKPWWPRGVLQVLALSPCHIWCSLEKLPAMLLWATCYQLGLGHCGNFGTPCCPEPKAKTTSLTDSWARLAS